MPNQACPACGADTPRIVAAPSEFALVNYYRCPTCFHIWTTDKHDPTKLIEHVTPRPEGKDARKMDDRARAILQQSRELQQRSEQAREAKGEGGPHPIGTRRPPSTR